MLQSHHYVLGRLQWEVKVGHVIHLEQQLALAWPWRRGASPGPAYFSLSHLNFCLSSDLVSLDSLVSSKHSSFFGGSSSSSLLDRLHNIPLPWNAGCPVPLPFILAGVLKLLPVPLSSSHTTSNPYTVPPPPLLLLHLPERGRGRADSRCPRLWWAPPAWQANTIDLPW